MARHPRAEVPEIRALLKAQNALLAGLERRSRLTRQEPQQEASGGGSLSKIG